MQLSESNILTQPPASVLQAQGLPGIVASEAQQQKHHRRMCRLSAQQMNAALMQRDSVVSSYCVNSHNKPPRFVKPPNGLAPVAI